MIDTAPTPPTRRATRFWNLLAKRYARSPIADEASYQHKLALTQAELRSDMQLLEFGCGTGTTALTHAPHVAHIDAIDYSRAMIEIAQVKAQAAGVSNVSFARSAIEDWIAPDASYDVVMGMSVIHLVTDRAALLARVQRLLRPGGLFISSTPCLGDMSHPIKVALPALSALRIMPVVGQLTGAELTDELERAGFSIETSWRPAPDASVFIIARAPG